MAGGTFLSIHEKKRAGTYINFKSSGTRGRSTATRGITVVPLNDYDWGPEKTFIEVDASSPDKNYTLLGRSVYDNNAHMLLIREALKNASTVLVYNVGGTGGAKATVKAGALTATAKFNGTKGNSLKIAVTANMNESFDVSVYLDTSLVVEYKDKTKAEDLANVNNDYIVFTGTGDLTAVAGSALTGGKNNTSSNINITDFLDACEMRNWNTMAFPFSDSSLQAALLTKIKYMRETMGKKVQAAAPNFKADYEGIINVTNSVKLEDADLTTEQATAFVAGISAGASKLVSNTYKTYTGAIGVVGEKTHEQAVTAIDNGEFFFSMSEAGEVIVEYDINSFVSFTEDKNEDFRKNKIIRILDTLATELSAEFKPNRFTNDETGWSAMESLGRSIIKTYVEDGSLTNPDYDNDFLVDRSVSVGDMVVFNVGVQPVDAAEKLFFNITTR